MNGFWNVKGLVYRPIHVDTLEEGKNDEGKEREMGARRVVEWERIQMGMNNMMLQGLFINEIRRCMTWHQVDLGYSFVKVYTSIVLYMFVYIYIPKLITLQSK